MRSVRAGDREAIASAFASMDPKAIYRRFFTHKKELNAAELRSLTEVDLAHMVALVVVDSSGGALLGGGRYCAIEPFTVARGAELAFTTADGNHRRGIASLLLRHLVTIARARGLARHRVILDAFNQTTSHGAKKNGLEPVIISLKYVGFVGCGGRI